MFRTIFVFAVFIMQAADVAAFCSEPDAPYCASSYGKFDDEYEFDRCKSEIETYQSEVETYVSCIKRKASEVISEYEEAVSSFNRRAGG